MTTESNSSFRKLLTIGMATYDDYDGVYFTVQAIRMFHAEVAGAIEVVVVDNHPDGPCAADLKALGNWVPGYRYIPCATPQGTAVRDAVFRHASGEFVMCVDCHVMFVPGALRKLLDYFEAHPDTPDLLQGPLIYDDLGTFSTHMDRTWSTGMYGVWGSDARAADPAAPPFEIGLQGLGVFACRKAAWPGFNPRLRGFGGEEGYIHEKFRHAGGRVLCLPFLRWIHRFARPMGVPYTNSWEDRIRNYLIIADELGQDPAPAIEHFRRYLGHAAADRIVSAVRSEIGTPAVRSEMGNPFDFFSAIYCINLAQETERWRKVSARFTRLGIADRVRRFEAIRTQPNHHIGCGLSHRSVVAEAKKQGLANVLVFEDDVLFTNDAIPGLHTGLDELRGRLWKLFYLGACRWRREFPPLPGLQRLAQAGAVTCTHAVAYDQSGYDRILHEVPGDLAGMEAFLQVHRGLDQYYAFSVTEEKYLLTPVIATQPAIVPIEAPEVQQRLLP